MFFDNNKYGRFRSTKWDCWLLFGQIISMQFGVYFLLGGLMLLVSFAFGLKFAISSLFDYNFIRFSEFGGKMVVGVFTLNSMLAAFLLWLIVQKAKQCLDFSCTFHGFHLIICWWYNSSLPPNLSWWLLNVITTAVMCIGGEFLCLKSELNKIPVAYSALNEKFDV